MTDVANISSELKKKNDRMFVLVCFNFGMLLILFCALMYVAWQSATLVGDIRAQLQQAEQSVAELRGRIQSLDAEVVMDRVMQRATDRLQTAVGDAIERSELAQPLTDLAERVDAAQQRLSTTGEAIQSISENLRDMNTEDLAQRVSYNILKGLGDGFSRAAEERKPGK
jgi:chromosome segregation ATPase